MLTKAAVQILTVAAIVSTGALGARDTSPYKNFELTKNTSSGPSGAGKLYVSERFSVKNAIRQKTPKVDLKKFLFAKEAFLSEKREEAIKLLRQQMDSGLNINRENMLLRLGQLYAEKYMELSYQETEILTAKLQQWETDKTAGKKTAMPKPDNTRSKKYLKDALTLFYELERKYPKHPKIDEIIFFIGFVEMEGGKRDKGAKYLERLVKQFPKSRKYEDAVIYLGDYYFDKNNFKAAHAKFAILAHQKDSPMFHYANYKLAWCELNLMRGDKALRDMKRLVKDLEGSNDPAKFNLREQALRDLVVFYGDAGNIDDAMDFFYDTVGKDKAIQNLRQIADIMRTKARDAEAIKAYQRLMNEAPDSVEAPMIQLGIYESLNRMDKTEKAVEALAYALDHYGPKSDWASSFRGDKAELKSTLKTLEEEGTKAAYFYHASAQKGSNKALYGYALTLYDSMLRNYPEHADRKKFLFYKAEVLYGQKKWLNAADAYMEASKITPKDKMTDEAVYNALLALDQLTAKVEKIERYTEEQQKKMDMDPRDIPEGEQKFIEIAQYYMKEYPKGSRIVDVQFRIAAIYYRYHHFDRAMELFVKIAQDHPKHRSATTAAYIVLDVLNMQKNYDGLDQMARKFAQMPDLGDKKFQAEMKTISSQIGFKQVEKLEADNKWAKAAETYMALYKSDPSGELAEKSLYNALVSYEKAGETLKSQEVTRQFIAKYPKSKYSETLMLAMAKNAEKLYDFEEAQKLYHDFHKNQPKNKEARKALYNSALFAEMLEHNAAAVERYNEYTRSGNVSHEEAKAIQISLAKLYRKQGNWEGFAKIYRQLVRDTPKAEDKLVILGDLARQYDSAGKASAKQDTVREIRALFNASGKSVKNIGMAAFYIAENEYQAMAKQRDAYEKTEIRFPVQDLVYLVGLKQRRLKNLGMGYDKVIDLGVPEWGVAALHDKAESFANYGITFRKVSIPAKMKGDERKEAEIGLKKLESEVVTVLDKQAEEFYKVCAQKAVEFHVTNEFAGKCRARAKAEAAVEVGGQSPQPNVASDRVKAWDSTVPSPDDKGRYLDYLASIAGSRGEGVERKIKDFVAKNPTEKRALFILATHYHKVKKEEMAQYFFNQLEKDSNFEWKSGIYNSLGLQALAERNRPAALEYFQKATKADPPSAAAHTNLGAIYLQSRSYSDAEKMFRRAEAIDDQSEEAVLGLGVALEGQGKFQEAHDVYNEFIGENPKAMAVLYNDALILGNRLGQKEKAQQLMTRYIQNGGRESAKAQETLRNWR